MPNWLSLIALIVGKLFEALFSALRLKRLDEESATTHERAGAAEAGNETLEVINEVADARSNLPDPPDDADALAGELRKRKSGGSRNFGNPGKIDTGGKTG